MNTFPKMLCYLEGKVVLDSAGFESKMAEFQSERFVGTEGVDMHCTLTLEEASQANKRPLDRTPSPEPPSKSPRTSSSNAAIPSLSLEQPPDDQKSSGAVAPDLSPRSRRKSWRRSTKGRRSLPALPNATHSLCKSISSDLRDDERLEKLMEAAMELAVTRLQNTLLTLPGTDLESLRTQVDSMQVEWSTMAKTIKEEYLLSSSNISSDPVLQKAIKSTKEAISRLQAESLSWESLLNKHRSKAEELAKQVEQGQEKGLALDPACLAQSSQSKVIQNKPDYQSIMRRQQSVLSTMELVLDSQCMMMQSLLSFQEQSQLLVKETSIRLAQQAGIEDLPSSPVRQLLHGPLSTTSS